MKLGKIFRKNYELKSKIMVHKKAIFCFLVMIFLGANVFGQKNDVIVRTGKYFDGFETRILNTDDTRIYYIQFKSRGREKEKKINQRKVAFTLTFDENALLKIDPKLLDSQSYLFLPAYNLRGTWAEYGRGYLANVLDFQTELKKIESGALKDFSPLLDDFMKGVRLVGIANGMYSISYLLGGIPLIIVGSIFHSAGNNKVNNSFIKYYNDFVDFEKCAGYGIIITPYNMNKAIKLK